MNKAKKIMFSSAIATVLVVGVSAAVYTQHSSPVAPQYSDPSAPGYVKISRTEYERMSDIVIAVNKGELPVSALKDAEPLLERSPESITKKTRAEYNALKK
ncbi:hypothetical protein [Paenibacillus contaminans]|uniref:Uncharacterized protein n=1 Tax=Paenibacillus contaminans TaxID=450362 RepID=A0A329M0W7_9BACL|nr:hypothetical protein [Paenibacillus contaminans]RAV13574.1 hypothetical protein DQG23_32780 [Paenibacillus contaminans]